MDRLSGMWLSAAVFGAAATAASLCCGQFGAGGAATVRGVYVDSERVLRTIVAAEHGRLAELRGQAPLAEAGPAGLQRSRLRRVSLVRLAEAVQRRLANGEPIEPELRHLAGLLRIDYIFAYPDQGELVIAGPAETWAVGPEGRLLGRWTGRPVLWLDDLVVALRLYRPGVERLPPVGCSIDPTEAGLKRMHEFVASLSGRADPSIVSPALLAAVRQRLGLHTVRLISVPPDTHLAAVLIEADYRMKLIGLGLEPSGVRQIVSYTAMLRPGSFSPRQLLRWWFVPEYESITATAEQDAFQLEGQRVRLACALDLLDGQAAIVEGQRPGPLMRRFALAFTRHYESLAAVKPVYAELQNAFDAIMAAAIIRKYVLDRTSRDKLAVFYDDDGYPVTPIATPRYAESAINCKWVGHTLVMPVGGGVLIQPEPVLASGVGTERRASRKGGQQNRRRPERLTLTELPAGDRWWWD